MRAEGGREGRVGVSDWGLVSVRRGLGAHKGRPYGRFAERGRGAWREQGQPFGQPLFAVSGGAESQAREEGARETAGEGRVKASNPLNPGTRFSWQPQMWTAPLGQLGA